MPEKVQVQSISNVTHDVLRVTTEKPKGYSFVPGQATEIAVDKAGWQDERRPFTFTSLPEDDHLEFTIKVYPEHKGVTNELLTLQPGGHLILHDVFGAIAYKGPGVFIAGGAGVTPFIAIFKQLLKQNAIGSNKLLFANKTRADIIHEELFTSILGNNFINILSDEKTEKHHHGFITKEFLQAHMGTTDQVFYICGPEPMMDAVERQLTDLKVSPSSIVKEEF